MSKSHHSWFARVLCILLIALGFWLVVSDAPMRWFGVSQGIQYAVNIGYFLVLPLLIYGSGWVEYIDGLKYE